MIQNYTVHNIKELAELTQKIVSELFVNSTHATIFTLSGDLGSGKTSFVQQFAKALGISESVTSPTFVIQSEYEILHSPFKKLVHMDAYRIEDIQELKALRFSETLADPENIVCIEWPEMLEGFNIPKTLSIRLEILREDTRTVTIEKHL